MAVPETRDRSQLPYLIKLLEDDTPTVRDSVLNELASYGPELEDELARLGIRLSADDVELVRTFAKEKSREWIRKEWAAWLALPDDTEKLEVGLSLMAEFQEDRFRPGKLKELLDALAHDYSDRYPRPDVRDLSSYLFTVKRLEGAKEDYYNPRNSSLVYAIEQRKGIPISLVCIYMLVGKRLGLRINGCNFPGHFLALAYEHGKPLVIDCFNGGLLVDNNLLARYLDPVSVTVDELARLQADTTTIITRVLRNLINAYRAAGMPEEVTLMKELLGGLKKEG